MRFFIVLLSLICLVSVAPAEFPGPDSIGVYEDPEATGEVVAGCMLPPFETKRLYLCVTQPSGGQVAAWEGTVSIESAGAYFGAWEIPPHGINVGGGDEYIVGHGYAPLQPNEQDVVVLMEIGLALTEFDQVVEFYVGPVPGTTHYVDSANYACEIGCVIPLANSTGDVDTPVYVVNAEAPVSNSASSWSGVKRLFE